MTSSTMSSICAVPLRLARVVVATLLHFCFAEVVVVPVEPASQLLKCRVFEIVHVKQYSMSRVHRGASGHRWRAVRAEALLRDGYRCQCGKAGALEVDHIVPVHRGGEQYDLHNLQTLCRRCHLLKHRGERRRESPARAGWRALVDAL